MFSSRLLIKPTAVQIDRTKDASPFSIIVLHNVVRNRTLALLIAHSYATPLSYLEPNAAQVSLRTLVQHCCAEISAHRASNAPQDTWASRIPQFSLPFDSSRGNDGAFSRITTGQHTLMSPNYHDYVCCAMSKVEAADEIHRGAREGVRDGEGSTRSLSLSLCSNRSRTIGRERRGN